MVDRTGRGPDDCLLRRPAGHGVACGCLRVPERTRWLDDDGVLTHGEMATDHGLIMMATPTPDYEGPPEHRSHCDRAAAWSAAPWVIDGVLVYVDDIETHFSKRKAAGPRCSRA